MKALVKTSLKWGSIRDMDEKDIYCILQKDFELDHELVLARSLLTDRQNKIATLGLIVRYNFDNGVFEFMLKDGNWC